MREPDLDQLRDWKTALSHLQVAMEEAYGGPTLEMYDDKLPTLVRFAWEEAVDQIKRREGPGAVVL